MGFGAKIPEVNKTKGPQLERKPLEGGLECPPGGAHPGGAQPVGLGKGVPWTSLPTPAGLNDPPKPSLELNKIHARGKGSRVRHTGSDWAAQEDIL